MALRHACLHTKYNAFPHVATRACRVPVPRYT